MAAAKETKTRALCVATRCLDAEQFVAAFSRFCDHDSIFVATPTQRRVGLETAFAIQLADKTPVLRGTCVVRESWATPANRFGRPGIRLGFVRLTRDSVEVFKRLRDAANEAAPPEPEPAPIVSRPPPPPPVQALPQLAPLPSTTPPPVPSTATPPGSLHLPPPVSRLPVPRPASSRPATVQIPVVRPRPAEPASVLVTSSPPTPPRPPTAPVVHTAPVPVVAIPLETRTPGSELVLPANPLMNLTDESLEGFVDCTLYEAHAQFPIDEDTPVPSLRPTPNPLPPIDPPLAPPSGVIAVEEPAAPRVEESAAQIVLAPPTGSIETWEPVPGPAPAFTPAAPQHAPWIANVGSDGINLHERPMLRAAPAVPATTTAGFGSMRRMPRRRWWLIAGPAIVVIVGIGIAIVPAQSTPTAATPAPAPAVAPSPGTRDPGPVAAVTPTPDPAANPTALEPTPDEPPEVEPPDDGLDGEPPEVDAQPTDGASLPIVGKGPCRISIVVEPAGATIRLDGQVVGPSPLMVDGPCVKRRLDLAHARYQAVTQWATPAEGTTATVDVTLTRPSHKVMVETQPAGATISINGRRAGTSPTAIQIMGFQSMKVTAQKAGFQTVTQKIYSKKANDRVVIKLVGIGYLKRK